MTDDNQNENNAQQPEGMEQNQGQEQQQRAPLLINAQFIKDLSFEAPHVPQIFTEMTQPPSINVDIDVKANKFSEQNMFGVDLRITAEGKTNDKSAFLIDLVYGALATINLPEEHLEAVLLIEVPRLLFPFAREIIADVTTKGGFPPLMISPIDFTALYRQRMMHQQEAAAAAGAAGEGEEEQNAENKADKGNGAAE